jgi:CNT family concentrative nucleoside transporter
LIYPAHGSFARHRRSARTAGACGAFESALAPDLTCALCGFANFGSLGIMFGGMSAMAPGRKHEIVAPGLRLIAARRSPPA